MRDHRIDPPPPPRARTADTNHPQDRFEGHGGEGGEAFNKPTSRTFSRRSLLQAREKSIALGHSMRFKETFEKNKQHGGNGNLMASTTGGRLTTTTHRRSSGQSDHEADDGPLVAPEGASEVDAHMFLSRHSWGSASSARRRHNAAVRGKTGVGVTAPTPLHFWLESALTNRNSVLN